MVLNAPQKPRGSWSQKSALYGQRGVALITVLMVFAIATLIATKIITQKTLDAQRVAGMVNRTQAHYYALAAEELAILALKKDFDDDVGSGSAPVDSLDEAWASSAIPFEIDNIGNVLIQIVDLNRFYNLNNLRQQNGEVNIIELERFRGMLVELDIDSGLADNVKDWLDKNDKEEGYGSESASYEQQSLAYRAANRPFADTSELRLVNGFPPEVLDKLLPHITAINTYGVLTLNVNTASSYALTSLQRSSSSAGGLSLSVAENIISARPYDSPADFNARGGAGSPASLSGVTLSGGGYINNVTYAFQSTYFEINIRASYAGSIAYLTTVVQENSGNFVVLSRRETDNSARFIQFSN